MDLCIELLTYVITEEASLVEVDDMSHQEVEDVVSSLAMISIVNHLLFH